MLTLSSLKPGWNFYSFDATRRSGGLAIGHNSRTIKVTTSWGGLGFIGMDIFLAELGMNIWVINVYGPCQRQEDF